MTEDTAQPGDLGTDDYTTDMVSALANLQDDVDFDSAQRHDDGWVKFYVECPDCEVPMAQTTTEHTHLASTKHQRRSRTRMHCICPACGRMESNITVHRSTQPYGEKHRHVP